VVVVDTAKTHSQWKKWTKKSSMGFIYEAMDGAKENIQKRVQWVKKVT
jgi:hypothetical protein